LGLTEIPSLQNKFTNHSIHSCTAQHGVKETENNGDRESADNKMYQHNSPSQIFDHASNFENSKALPTRYKHVQLQIAYD
jgi:hypothetical protein